MKNNCVLSAEQILIVKVSSDFNGYFCCMEKEEVAAYMFGGSGLDETKRFGFALLYIKSFFSPDVFGIASS